MSRTWRALLTAAVLGLAMPAWAGELTFWTWRQEDRAAYAELFAAFTKAHPGSAVVPAALAMAEKDRRSGIEFLRAVVLGYDVCCRFLMALGPDHVRATHRSAEGTSATFGATAAAASLARLDERGTDWRVISGRDLATWVDGARVLTDELAPVDQLLTPYPVR